MENVEVVIDKEKNLKLVDLQFTLANNKCLHQKDRNRSITK